MELKVQRLKQHIVETQADIFMRKVALIKESSFKALQLLETRLGLTPDDLAEINQILEAWATDFVIKAHEQITASILPYIELLALDDYVELMKEPEARHNSPAANYNKNSVGI